MDNFCCWTSGHGIGAGGSGGSSICVRAGAHCAPLMHKALGTVEQGVVRFSFSHFNTEAEVLQTAAAVQELAQEI